MPVDPYIARGPALIGDGWADRLRENRLLQERNALAQQGAANQNALIGAQINNLNADNERANQELDLRRQAADKQRRDAALQKAYAGAQHLAGLVNDPAQFNLAADYYAMDPDISGLGITRDQITPQNVQSLLAQRGTAAGAAPAAPKSPGTLYKLANGSYATAEQAVGQPAYQEPRQPQRPGYSAPQDGINPATGKQAKFIIDDYGRVTWLDVAPAPPASASKVTDVERTASGFLDRMTKAEAELGDYQPGVKDYIGFSRILNGGPTSASLVNAMMSEKAQKYYQAASDWVRSKLRKESGAVIGPQEMEQEIRTYFPMPGDSAAVVKQKARARQTAQNAMRTSAGPADSAPTTPGRRVRVDAEGNVIGN